MFHGSEQQRAEPATFFGNRGQPVFLQQAREKVLREIRRLVHGFSTPSEESVNRIAVGLVEDGKSRLPGRRILSGRFENDRPMSALKSGRTSLTCMRLFRLCMHGYDDRVGWPPSCHKLRL